MKKILLIAAGMAILAGTPSSVRADDMGNMPGMNMGGTGQNNGSMQNTNTNDSSSKSYPAKGVVQKITSDHRTATIDTDKIPGYMDKMTMDYLVQDTNELKGILPGDIIRFTLVVSSNSAWIEDIHRTGHSNIELTNNIPMQMNMSHDASELGTGDMLPNGVLTAEDGREIHFSDFRGEALAFTFFYTRCPLPNYCPLMNRNFADTRDMLLSKPNAPTNWEFLSISFDPDSDTPQVLAAYGGFYRHGNSSHWLFASAPKSTLTTLASGLDLMVAHQGSAITHNLRTVVLDTNGRIYHQFDGNQWTPNQLAGAMMDASHL
jgi:protein SCO1